jgi:hypothetical protein
MTPRGRLAKATMLQNQLLQMMWHQAKIFEHHFLRMHWSITTNTLPTYVTSDRAVAWYVPGHDHGSTEIPAAMRVDGAKVTVAMSARVALWGMSGRHRRRRSGGGMWSTSASPLSRSASSSLPRTTSSSVRSN